MAIDASRGRLYASDEEGSLEHLIIEVYQLSSPHTLIETIDGSSLPEGSFLSGFLSASVDESSGNLLVYEGKISQAVYELTAEGQYLATIENGFSGLIRQIAVDNGPESPNGVLNPDGRYFWLPSGSSGVGHAFAFGPVTECPPSVESVSVAHVGEEEADLRAEVEPCQLETTYAFEYVAKQDFEETGFAQAQPVGQGTIAAGQLPVKVSVPATGLAPETTYVFRAVATNSLGSDERTGEFKTYPAAAPPHPCSNEAVRTGPSALLPDCRAYELVTPADTNAHDPLGLGLLGIVFATREASPDGNRVSFRITGGVLPGIESTGVLNGDPYLATRGADGWSTAAAGPNGTETTGLIPGSASPDQGYSFWESSGEGSAIVDGQGASYLRYPDGHSELLGRGSVAIDPGAQGKLISEDGAHVIFTSVNGNPHVAVQLEPNAPPDGTGAIYDRTPDEATHVVSLLPGDLTPAPGESAVFTGASLDGRGVAFKIDAGNGVGSSPLYLRRDNAETFAAAPPGSTLAGIAEGGGRLLYLNGGSLYAFDTETEATIPFAASGDVTPVNVSADGSSAYLVSPSVLTSAPNPQGAKAKKGKEGRQNLYLSREGAIGFVGIVTERDVVGENPGNVRVDGLGLWSNAVAEGDAAPAGGFGADPSRSTADGNVLLFQSRGNLASYESGGRAEVYRYQAGEAPSLVCLSCNPTGAAASGDATLQSITQDFQAPEPLTVYAPVSNLTTDGRRAFFQSPDALVPGDIDGLQDVYQWEAQGAGDCQRPAGCISLISSGHGNRTDYLYAVSDSGDDVFIQSADLLLPERDPDETPSIYDARVNGGFATAAGVGECLGEACQPAASPPDRPVQVLQGSGNVSSGQQRRACPRAKREVRVQAEVRCLRPRHKRHRHPTSHSRADRRPR